MPTAPKLLFAQLQRTPRSTDSSAAFRIGGRGPVALLGAASCPRLCKGRYLRQADLTAPICAAWRPADRSQPKHNIGSVDVWLSMKRKWDGQCKFLQARTPSIGYAEPSTKQAFPGRDEDDCREQRTTQTRISLSMLKRSESSMFGDVPSQFSGIHSAPSSECKRIARLDTVA